MKKLTFLFVLVLGVVLTMQSAWAQVTFSFDAATYNSTSKGYEVTGIGTFFKSTSGGTTTLNSLSPACNGTLYAASSSSTFYFLVANAIPAGTNALTLYGTGTGSNRTLTSLSSSTTLTGTYAALSVTSSSTMTTSGTCGNITITTTTAITSGTYLKFVFSGNINLTAILMVTSLPPAVTTGSASAITTTGAGLSGTVNANGYSTVVKFYDGTSTSYTDSIMAVESPVTGSAATSVSATLSTLTANTLYHFRAGGANTGGISYGSDATFTTLPGAPAVAAASSITSISLMANWTAPIGGTEALTYVLNYGTDSTFASFSTISSIASTSQPVTGLSAGTTYYYRVQAVNTTGGSAWSSVQSAATNAPTPTLSLGSGSLSFSNTEVASTLTAKSYTISGAYLSPASGNITVTAPAGFQVSADSTSYSASINIAYSSSTLSSTKVYVRFAPSTVGAYNDNVINAGGGATTQNVAVTGTALDHPTATLASVSGAAGQIAQSSTKNSIYTFTLGVSSSTASAVLNTVNFTTSGTATTSDVSKFQLYYNTTNSLSGAVQIGSDIAATGAGVHSFTGLTQSIASGATGYLWITADVLSGATVGNTVGVAAMANTDIALATGSVTGSGSAGDVQTIIVPSAAGDYFRSAANGAWSSPSTWQSSTDTTLGWHTATLAPDSTAASVTVLSGHIVTINAATKIGTTIVNNGGELDLSTTGTLSLASSKTLYVAGTLVNYYVGTTFALGASSTIMFASTGVYNLATAPGSLSGVAFIPAATWNTGSTVQLSLGNAGATVGDYTGLNGIKQTFSNFVINSPNLNQKLLLTKNSSTTAPYLIINGNLSVVSTGTGTGVQLTSSGVQNAVTVGGNYVQSGGNVYIVQNASSAATRSLTVTGDFTLSDSSVFDIANTTGSSTTNINYLYAAGNITIGAGSTLRSSNTAGTVSGLVFSGTAAQTMTNNGTFASTGAALLGVTVNNASGVTLGSDITVPGTLTLTSGNIITGSQVLTANSVNRTSGYVIGNLKKTALASAATFDVGTANGYAPVTITPAGSGDVTVTTVGTKHPNRLSDKILNMYWTLNAGSGITAADLVFKYLSGDISDAKSVYDLASWNGSVWQYQSGTADTANNTISKTAVTAINGDWTAAISGPAMSASPASLNFGSIVLGNAKMDSVKVKSNGTAALTVDSVKSSSPEFVSTSLSGTIAVGDSATVTITFTPSAAGARNGKLYFYHNTVIDSVTVGGTGIGAAGFAFNKTAIAIATTGIGSSRTDSISVMNPGTDVLTIDSVKSSSTEFVIAPISGTVAVGDSAKFMVTFTPSTAGTRNGKLYFYHGTHVDSIAVSGTGEIILSVDNLAGLGIPKTYQLSQNYPNPFNPSTTIRYGLPNQSRVTIKIYSMLGQELVTLFNGTQAAGYHEVVWQASHMASGMYFFRIKANAEGSQNASFVQVKKMVLMK